jgi:6-phosphofructokinase 2
MDRVVTVTLNPAVDMSTATEYVVADRKLRCDTRTFDPGGGGINVARVLRELGVPALAIWTRGGLPGQRLEALLDGTGIEHRAIPIEGDTRDHLMVVEGSSGRQFRFNLPGPILTAAELEACVATVADLDPVPPYLVLSGSLPKGAPEDFYARLARAAPAGCKVVLDTSDAALARGIEAPLFLVKPNAGELARLAGIELEGEHHIRDVARALIRHGGVEVVITSLGPAGATATTIDEHWHVAAPTVNLRSAVGAGDSMVGGIVAALARGRSLADAIRYGVAAGTAAVKTDGTQLCRRADVERLYASM